MGFSRIEKKLLTTKFFLSQNVCKPEKQTHKKIEEKYRVHDSETKERIEFTMANLIGSSLAIAQMMAMVEMAVFFSLR